MTETRGSDADTRPFAHLSDLYDYLMRRGFDTEERHALIRGERVVKDQRF